MNVKNPLTDVYVFLFIYVTKYLEIKFCNFTVFTQLIMKLLLDIISREITQLRFNLIQLGFILNYYTFMLFKVVSNFGTNKNKSLITCAYFFTV